jgi:hypothetical protein
VIVGRIGCAYNLAMAQIIGERETNSNRAYSLERRIEYGAAARHNRSQYTGTKVHRLATTWIVELLPGCWHRGTMMDEMRRKGQPVLFSAYPACGATQGQFAAQPYTNLTEANVTCTKCLKYSSKSRKLSHWFSPSVLKAWWRADEVQTRDS